MKYLDEYRDPEAARRLCAAIAREATRPWTLMEVCGGQTHSIVRYGVDGMLPGSIELLHGPGCPVCVTPIETVDRAHAIAARPGVIFCSYGDMLRVPGSRGDLARARSEGADVRVVYGPLDALNIARHNPTREVVFFAIGFETTAPANATAVYLARQQRITNFSALVSHVLVPPALRAIFESPGNRVQGLLGPGHVCSIMGVGEYTPIAERYGVPIVVTGFEPVDLLEGVLKLVRLLERGEASVEVQYGRVVRAEGNRAALDSIERGFEVCDRKWRGIGTIAGSGFRLRAEYAEQNAELRFAVADLEAQESPECISGEVLRGLKKPFDCAAFGRRCTPDQPLGATMVSSEGACAAYFHAGRRAPEQRSLPLVSA
jgi:hydrogenase expression/formation protein HypD